MPTQAPAAALRTLRLQFAAALADFLGDDFRWPVVVRVESRSGKLRLEFRPEDALATGQAEGLPLASGGQAEENSEEISGKLSDAERTRLDAQAREAPIARQVLDGADRTPRESVEIAQNVGADYTSRWRYWVCVLERLGYLERNRRTKKLRKLKDFDDE